MLFLDSNSYLIHRDINAETEKLEQNKQYFEQEIIQDEKLLNQLQTPEGKEKYAREKYYMKRENEDIYIIPADTIYDYD